MQAKRQSCPNISIAARCRWLPLAELRQLILGLACCLSAIISAHIGHANYAFEQSHNHGQCVFMRTASMFD